jgi:hypothetical protein
VKEDVTTRVSDPSVIHINAIAMRPVWLLVIAAMITHHGMHHICLNTKTKGYPARSRGISLDTKLTGRLPNSHDIFCQIERNNFFLLSNTFLHKNMYKVCHFEKQLSIISFSLCLYYLFTFDK